MKAKFEVKCEKMGFSRSQEVPIDGTGYCRELADNLSKAMDLYLIKVENRKLKHLMIFVKQRLENIVSADDGAGGDPWSAEIAKKALLKIEEVDLN